MYYFASNSVLNHSTIMFYPNLCFQQSNEREQKASPRGPKKKGKQLAHGDEGNNYVFIDNNTDSRKVQYVVSVITKITVKLSKMMFACQMYFMSCLQDLHGTMNKSLGIFKESLNYNKIALPIFWQIK